MLFRIKGFPSIRHKLFLTAILCILLPSAITLLTYNSLTQEAVKRQAISNAQDSLQLVHGSVTNLLKSMLNIANYMQVNSDMNAYFKIIASGNDTSSDPYTKFMNETRILQQLESLTVIGDKSYVAVLLANGKSFTNYSTSDYNPLQLMQEPWFDNVNSLRGFQSYWVATTPTVISFEKINNPYQISVVRTLRLDNKHIYGYIVITVMENQINHIFNRLTAGQDVVLVDADGNILSSSDSSRIGHKLEYPLQGGMANPMPAL
ncbi:cache domain-containing protein [Paenibacillus protaetiae]|uniref:cache domain-containing protein n=1 Tax=Paenibacillus protaetiae TaxID=2509456 RepID=UPI001FCA1D14|nr:cache domain-containing protein [Paenibacillus protaetiae]